MKKQTLTDDQWTLLDIDKSYWYILIYTNNDWVSITRKNDPNQEAILDMKKNNYYSFNFSLSGNADNIYVKWQDWDVINILYNVISIK